jgi:hypothetical protein
MTTLCARFGANAMVPEGEPLEVCAHPVPRGHTERRRVWAESGTASNSTHITTALLMRPRCDADC